MPQDGLRAEDQGRWTNIGRSAQLSFADDRYAPITVDATWIQKHNPGVGGYYVVYDDGYASYSPAKAFEPGYAKIEPTVGSDPERQLTAHKVNGCNESITISVGHKQTLGGAPTDYWIILPRPSGDPVVFDLRFQDGPIAEVGTNGVTHEALLAICIDRLQSFQRGPFSCRENALALTHLEDAMHWLNHRTRERVARGVEGTHKK